MKHHLKLQKDKHPLWHRFACANCGEVVRITTGETRLLLKGEWRFGYDFLPPCSPVVPEVKLSRAARERRMKQYSDCNLGEQK